MATMKSKPVSFNLDNPQEKALFDFCERVPKGQFGSFVKRLIAAEQQRMQAMKQQRRGE